MMEWESHTPPEEFFNINLRPLSTPLKTRVPRP